MNTMIKAWAKPSVLLFIMAAAVPFSLGTWMALINNFAIDRAAFTGADMGMLQSLREVPGFLSFTVIFLLYLCREQTLAIIALLLLGLGTAITGFFPSFYGLCLTTLVMSIGYHYFEAVNQSLQLQWLDKSEAPRLMGKLVAMGSASSIVAYALVYLMLDVIGLSLTYVYLLSGGVTVVCAFIAWLYFPLFPQKVEQHKTLILRQRYWLYYALVFMSGSRRQIFIVFASFLMVEKFGFSAADITLMFLVNMAANIVFAPMIGKLISKIGERQTLTLEYIGLIAVFIGYALVESAAFAVALYIIDHLFFAMAIATKTYFQKIAHPADIAPTVGISFSINHIAAVVVPVVFGIIWLTSPAIVFYAGAFMAFISLLLAQLIPQNPESGHETLLSGYLLKKQPSH